MNLTKNEIAAFLKIIIEKNPIIDIDIEDEILTIKRFDDSVQMYNIDFPELPAIEIPSPEKIDYDPIYADIEEKFQSYKDVLTDAIKNNKNEYSEKTEKLKEYIDRYIEDNRVVTENKQIIEAEIDFDKINFLIGEQLINVQKSLIRINEENNNSIQNINTSLINKEKTIREEFKSFYDELKSKIDNFPISVKEETVNYKYIENFIDTKIEELSKSIVIAQEKEKLVKDITNKRGGISVNFNDGTSTDITDLLVPILELRLSRLLKTTRGGGGGGGGGAPGLSAYQIALNNGFIGTEQDWLDSLSSGASSPQPGTIIYDTNDNITEIHVGSNITFINRDANNIITGITKPTYVKEFIRDGNNRITGWNILI